MSPRYCEQTPESFHTLNRVLLCTSREQSANKVSLQKWDALIRYARSVSALMSILSSRLAISHDQGCPLYTVSKKSLFYQIIKQHIILFEKLKPENVWHICFKKLPEVSIWLLKQLPTHFLSNLWVTLSFQLQSWHDKPTVVTSIQSQRAAEQSGEKRLDWCISAVKHSKEHHSGHVTLS